MHETDDLAIDCDDARRVRLRIAGRVFGEHRLADPSVSLAERVVLTYGVGVADPS